MDWKEAAEGEGARDRMSEGYHDVKVIGAYRFNKDGAPYESAKGPFVSVVFEDRDGSSASQSFWLTEKAGWRLARAMEAMGADLQKMTDADISLDHFLDEKFCQKQLVGRDCWIKVEHNGNYANADVVAERDIPPFVLAEANKPSAPPDSEIPF